MTLVADIADEMSGGGVGHETDDEAAGGGVDEIRLSVEDDNMSFRERVAMWGECTPNGQWRHETFGRGSGRT